ncbi:MAG: 3-oxoacyl-[acyl-carrier protein] reductase [Parasphingorhabdus sp.]|jgi:3-oxoacyl-[acyl-carrier protein] reductase
MSKIQFHLQGNFALITGGASGIGLATSELLARSGCKVAINDVNANKLDTEINRLRSEGFDVRGFHQDIGSKENTETLVNDALDWLGNLDYLINNAGTPNTNKVIPASDLDRLDESFWQTIMSVNLMAPFWITKQAAHALKARHGSVVNTTSTAAFFGGGSSLAYSVSKSALVGLTRELARGLAPAVRVNGIAPGVVNSDWQCRFDDREEHSENQVPLQRAGEPEDYAQTIVFLCAGGNYMTGEVVMVSGGLGI